MEAMSTVAVEVEDLDESGLLDAAAGAERLDRLVQLTKLRIAYQWCVQHPATTETGTATWGDAGLPGVTDCDASLGGEGTPAVAAFAAEALGAAMGVSTQSAMGLMACALDLRHRLPRLWALVENLEVAPYKTRRVAEDTRTPPLEAARWVDEQLAARVDGFGIPTIERLVAQVAARYAPEDHAAKERAAGPAGTSPSTTLAPVSSPAPPGSRPPATPATWPRSTPWCVRRPSGWGGSGTPTTTRPARPGPSASSPPARPPST